MDIIFHEAGKTLKAVKVSIIPYKLYPECQKWFLKGAIEGENFLSGEELLQKAEVFLSPDNLYILDSLVAASEKDADRNEV